MNTSIAKVLVIACFLMADAGCSNLGLTLWPSQLPILAKAKDYASRSPLPSGLEHEFVKQALPEYFVEPGDRLLIEPIELDSDFQIAGDQVVLVDGSVDLGRYGRVRVAGLTVEQIEIAVVNQINEVADKRFNINVQLLETNAAQVYVLGAVGSPGAFNIGGNETVLDAILMAGGLTSKASPCDIILVRPTDSCDRRVVQRVCFRQITQLGDVTSNYQIQPGDRVVVGERTLREELVFWKQASACPCCDRSQGVECRPESKDYRNRFINWLPAIPRPFEDKSNAEGEGDDNSVKALGSDQSTERPQPNQPNDVFRNTHPSDQDIFLPPELPSELPDESARSRRGNAVALIVSAAEHIRLR